MFLDIYIAFITVLTFFDAGNTQRLLIPVNYLLTTVVALSIIMFVVLLLLRTKERASRKDDRE
jgi:hypothetical protein